MSGITAETAFNRLNSIPKTIEDFKNLLDSISIDAEGSKSVFYTAMDDSEIAKLKNDPNIRIINKTEAAKFLETLYITEKNNPNYEKGQKLKQALTEIFGSDPTIKGTAAYDYVGGAGNGGAWDSISQRFAEATKGDVIMLAGENAKVERIMYQTEYPALKNNGAVTSINGTPTDEFKTSITDMNNEETINKLKTDTEARRIVSTQTDGTLDTNKLTTATQSDVKEAIVKDPLKSKELKPTNFLFTCKTFKTKKALHVKTQITHTEAKGGTEQKVA